MSSERSKGKWTVRVNASFQRRPGRSRDQRHIAEMFGLGDAIEEVLYDDFELEVAPGEIVAVVGPSGSGKTVLLEGLARQSRREVIWLDVEALRRRAVRALDALEGGLLVERLEILSRCGLAEAALLVCPAKYLSGGQLYRLALARALHTAFQIGRQMLVLADEFAASLDPLTAGMLAEQTRRLVTGSPIGLVLATPRTEILSALAPDRIVAKPLGGPARLIRPNRRRVDRAAKRIGDIGRWRISQGSIADYDLLGGYHYRGGRPAAHKRVHVIRPPRRLVRGEPALPPAAGVIVVSPPLLCVRGRNVATAGRYSARPRKRGIARLNREVESISRVVVHPMFRGLGLAVRLVRYVLRSSPMPIVEALAVMGHIHPFFELAGMTAWYGGGSRADYVYYDHWRAKRNQTTS